MANYLTTNAGNLPQSNLQQGARLPLPKNEDMEAAYLPSPEQNLGERIKETFIRGREAVTEGEKIARIGKTLAWGAAAVVGVVALTAGGLVIMSGGLLVGGLATALAGGASMYGLTRLLPTAVGFLGIGKSVRGVGIMRQRAGNNAMARCLTCNSDYEYYRTNRSAESENINALRHAISNRGEFFYPVPAQPQVESEIMKINTGLDQNKAETIGVYIGGGLGAFRDLLTNPFREARDLIRAAKM